MPHDNKKTKSPLNKSSLKKVQGGSGSTLSSAGGTSADGYCPQMPARELGMVSGTEVSGTAGGISAKR